MVALPQWWRQCGALVNKNRLVKSRLWASTLAEFLLPVALMCIMVGIRAAVEKKDYGSDLHYVAPQQYTFATAPPDTDLLLNGSVFSTDFGPYAFDPFFLSEAFRVGDRAHHTGILGVNTVEFLPGNSPDVQDMAQAFKQRYPNVAPFVSTKYTNEDDLDDYLESDDYSTSSAYPGVAIAVVISRVGNDWSYVIRGNSTRNALDSSTLDTESSTVNRLQTEYDGDNPAILLVRGHILMQDFVESYILTSTARSVGRTLQRSYAFQPFPTPPYTADPFSDVISSVLGLFFTIIYIWPVTRLVKGIVEEKQLKLREGMLMMGLRESALFCSWFVTYLFIFVVTSALITLVTSFTVYEHAQKGYIFLFFFLFALTVFAFCWLVSVFFTRSTVATTFAALIFLCIYFPFYGVQGSSKSMGAKYGASIFSPTCFGLGAVVLQELESKSTGIHANNAGTEIDNWSYNATIGMFIVDFVLYMVLAIYFSQVVPSEFGTHQPWYFCCLRRYWCPKKVDTTRHMTKGSANADGWSNRSEHEMATLKTHEGAQLAAVPHDPTAEKSTLVHQNHANDVDYAKGSVLDGKHRNGGKTASGAPPDHSRDSYFESVPESIKSDLGVSIQHLRKTFKAEGEKEPFVAVKDLSMDLYSGQILALLGHNGAGKSTTINMLCGMTAPTSGDAYVYGSSVHSEMSAIRQILGVCPQHDILYPLLSVKEHLELFAAIKNVPREQVAPAIEEMIAQVGLTEKRHEMSAALSGGQKRKLSVGIALLGDSKIIFLDEPTSGMDPYSRRATWDLLKKRKEGRVIILTTHFMDEADQLGDRIAIMAKGDVKCCGSSLFLKSKYGVGYTLTIVKGQNFNEPAVRELLRSSIEGVTQLSNIAAEISFRLPFNASASFADVFDAFDAHRSTFDIESYGISVTTLEEVFLRVGHEEEATPEAFEQRRKGLREAQRALSHSHPLASPRVDVYDIPHEAPQVVVAASTAPDGDGFKQSYEDGHGGGATHYRFHHDTPKGAMTVEQSIPEATLLGQIEVPSIGKSNGAAENETLAGAADAPLKHGVSQKERRAVDGAAVATAAVADAGLSPSAHRQATKKKQLGAHPHSSRFAGLRIPDGSAGMAWIHFRALFIKRLLNARRDRKVLTWTLVYPFLILLIGCGLVTQTQQNSSRQLLFTRDNLGQGTINNIPVVQQGGANLFVTPPPLPPQTQYEDFVPRINSVGAGIPAMQQALLDDIYPSPRQDYSRYNAYFSGLSNPSGDGATLVDNFVVFYNSSAQWSNSFGLNQYNNRVLAYLAETAGAPPTTIQLGIHPFPRTLNQQTLITSATAVIIAIGFAFIPANFIAYAVREEADKVKHQQLISGVSAVSYWAANYLYDFINFMVMGCLCLAIFRIWSIDQLTGDNTGAVFIGIVLFGLSVIPFNYMMSFLFNEPTSAQNSMLLFYIFTGGLFLIAIVVLQIVESTKDAASILKWILRVIPSFAFADAISGLIVRKSVTVFGTAQSTWEVVDASYAYMAGEIVVYSLIVLLYEKVKATPALVARIWGNPKVDAPNAKDEDEDVIAEKERLQTGSGAKDMIKVKGLRKVYKARLGGGAKIAVQDLWMGIPEGQCFGYLGINGAGKTTTLKMITGDILPTAGTATLNGLDILEQQNDVRRLLGYCPQFDALIDTLTAREHLMLFARIKGVPESILADYCEHLILKLGLQEGIADKPCKGYSGGNKRKLCVGMALIGNPPIVMLDEPSTGMDPASRRFMWNLIASTMKGRSVILTTHSMEECEALCHRLGIMVGGRLRCLGSTTHLKSKYGNGYQLDCSVAEEQHDAFKAHLKQEWPDLHVIERHGNSFKFRIPRESPDGRPTTIGSVFRLIEQCKQRFDIRDYSVSETTLEQIFIQFAKQQEEETGRPAGLED